MHILGELAAALGQRDELGHLAADDGPRRRRPGGRLLGGGDQHLALVAEGEGGLLAAALDLARRIGELAGELRHRIAQRLDPGVVLVDLASDLVGPIAEDLRQLMFLRQRAGDENSQALDIGPERLGGGGHALALALGGRGQIRAAAPISLAHRLDDEARLRLHHLGDLDDPPAFALGRLLQLDAMLVIGLGDAGKHGGGLFAHHRAGIVDPLALAVARRGEVHLAAAIGFGDRGEDALGLGSQGLTGGLDPGALALHRLADLLGAQMIGLGHRGRLSRCRVDVAAEAGEPRARLAQQPRQAGRRLVGRLGDPPGLLLQPGGDLGNLPGCLAAHGRQDLTGTAEGGDHRRRLAGDALGDGFGLAGLALQGIAQPFGGAARIRGGAGELGQLGLHLPLQLLALLHQPFEQPVRRRRLLGELGLDVLHHLRGGGGHALHLLAQQARGLVALVLELAALLGEALLGQLDLLGHLGGGRDDPLALALEQAGRLGELAVGGGGRRFHQLDSLAQRLGEARGLRIALAQGIAQAMQLRLERCHMGRELAVALEEGEEDPEEGQHPGIAREKTALLAGGELGEDAPADLEGDIAGDEDRPDQRQEQAEREEETLAVDQRHGGVGQAARRRPRISPRISAAACGILVPGP